MSKAMIPVRMSEELVARMDAKTENRSALIVAAVEAYLGESAKQMIIEERASPKVARRTSPIVRERETPKPEPKADDACRHCSGSLAVLNGARRCVKCWRIAPLNP